MTQSPVRLDVHTTRARSRDPDHLHGAIAGRLVGKGVGIPSARLVQLGHQR